MKTRLRRFGIIFIAIVLVLSMATVPSFAAYVAKPTITISGTMANNVYNSPVTIRWKSSTNGVSYSATLTQKPLDGNNTAVVYSQINAATTSTGISVNGIYTLKVTAIKNGSLSSEVTNTFTLDATAPLPPTITGVTDGDTYGTAVKATWNDVADTASSAILDNKGYTKNKSIDTNGSHTLKVTVKKNSNGLTSAAIVNFNIDTQPPTPPAIIGVASNQTYGTTVTPSWTDEDGTTSTAILNKGTSTSSYAAGSPISEDGTYKLTVTATKNVNGKTASTTVSFTIDTVPPSPPIITGVTEGTVYGTDVTPTWNNVSGTTSSAVLDGSTYRGGAISNNGDHKLVVTAKKTANNLTAAALVNFTIDKLPPTPPAITGVASGIRYGSAVTPAWTDVTGTTSTATLDNSSYTKGTAIGSNGSHTLVVTARKTSNGLTASTTVTFSMDLSNGDWSSRYVYLKNTPEADLMVRVGDVDNFGFGWTSTSPTFDPFSGNNTNTHSFPWPRPTDETAGLDKIMVVSGYGYGYGVPTDGYTSSTSRPSNNVEPITLAYDMTGIKVYNAALQLFVDDFQPAGAKGIGNGGGKAKYQVTINGVRVPELEDTINKLDQSGPIGKMITVAVPSQILPYVQDGNLILKIDDPSTGGADGYAIDFVKLLVNLKTSDYRGTITGTVTDSKTRRPIEGATITISGRNETATTASNGIYTFNNITAGQVAMTAYKDGYGADQRSSVDVKASQTATVDFVLTPNDTSAPVITLTQTPSASAITTHRVTVSAIVTDADSGIAEVKYVKGQQTASYVDNYGTSILNTRYFYVDYETQGTYTVYARDTAGNASVRTITVDNIYRFGNHSILVSPQSGDSNNNFTVTLNGSSTNFQHQYNINGGSWHSYTNGDRIPVHTGDTVNTRDVDSSVAEDIAYSDVDSRRLDYVVGFVNDKGAVVDKLSLNSLKKGEKITVTVKINSSAVNPSNPNDYLKFEGITDAVNINYKSYDNTGTDSYLLTYEVTANKAGFNGTINFVVTTINTIKAPLKVQTISTQGIM